MTNKLNSSIAQIISEAVEFGYCPDIQKVICKANGLPFHLIIGPDNKKAALVGMMLDYYQNEVLKAYGIDFCKWNWASTEGFRLDDIFKDINLYSDVFTELPAHKVSEYLVD